MSNIYIYTLIVTVYRPKFSKTVYKSLIIILLALFVTVQFGFRTLMLK